MAPHPKIPERFPKDEDSPLGGRCSAPLGDSAMSSERGPPVQNSISGSAATAPLLLLLSNVPLPSSVFYKARVFEECHSLFFLIFTFITFVRSFVCSLVCRCVLYMWMCWGCEHARAPMWRSEDHLQNLGLSLHRGGPRPCTPVKRPLLSAPLERARFPVCASVVSIELLLSYPESGMGGSVPSLRTTSGGPQLSVPHLPGECVFFTPSLV